MIQVELNKERKLTLSDFQQKKLHLDDKNFKFMGFQLHEKNNRTKDFFKVYIERRDIDLYPFQLNRYSNQLNEYIMQQNSENFIVLQYVEQGKFLNQIEKIAFQTFKKIFLQLIHAIYLLHRKFILARCISSQNIFFDPEEDKIYLFEFGFSPIANFQEEYKPNYDITLLINIMKDLNQKRIDPVNAFDNLMNKICHLEKELPKLNEIESYFQLYQLIEGGPSTEQQQTLYNQDWVLNMKQKIKTLDFPPLINFESLDPELTDDDSYIRTTNLQFLQFATEIIQHNLPNEYNQIGLMLRYQSILNDQSYSNNMEPVERVNKRKEKINARRLEISSRITSEGLLSVIKPEYDENNRTSEEKIKSIIKLYKFQTYDTYKKHFKEKIEKFSQAQQFTVEDIKGAAKISLILIASLELDDFVNAYRIYKSGGIADQIKKILDILQKYTSKTK